MQLNRQFIHINNDMFEVLRAIREDHKPIIETWKEHLRCEQVFRKDGYLYFVQKVEDVEFEELTENSVQQLEEKENEEKNDG